MSTITVTLGDEQLLQVRGLAREAGRTPEEWLQGRIESLLAGNNADFEQAASYVLVKNQELYRRLA